ncbi:hypothetical protein PG995_007725 [Apiospora arundinis]
MKKAEKKKAKERRRARTAAAAAPARRVAVPTALPIDTSPNGNRNSNSRNNNNNNSNNNSRNNNKDIIIMRSFATTTFFVAPDPTCLPWEEGARVLDNQANLANKIAEVAKLTVNMAKMSKQRV